MKKYLFLLLIIAFAGCAKEEVQITQKEVTKDQSKRNGSCVDDLRGEYEIYWETAVEQNIGYVADGDVYFTSNGIAVHYNNWVVPTFGANFTMDYSNGRGTCAGFTTNTSQTGAFTQYAEYTFLQSSGTNVAQVYGTIYIYQNSDPLGTEERINIHGYKTN